MDLFIDWIDHSHPPISFIPSSLPPHEERGTFCGLCSGSEVLYSVEKHKLENIVEDPPSALRRYDFIQDPESDAPWMSSSMVPSLCQKTLLIRAIWDDANELHQRIPS
jgi:hypothetical protein